MREEKYTKGKERSEWQKKNFIDSNKLLKISCATPELKRGEKRGIKKTADKKVFKATEKCSYRKWCSKKEIIESYPKLIFFLFIYQPSSQDFFSLFYFSTFSNFQRDTFLLPCLHKRVSRRSVSYRPLFSFPPISIMLSLWRKCIFICSRRRITKLFLKKYETRIWE